MKHLIFVGQLNAVFGRPHRRTGRYNTYGDVLQFDTRKQRDDFYDNSYSSESFTRLVKTNYSDCKRLYLAGLTQLQYDEYLNTIDNETVIKRYQVKTLDNDNQ